MISCYGSTVQELATSIFLMAPTSTQGDSLSSPSSIRLQWKHDAFLSFKGEDTRNTFTGHLYTIFKQKGIYTFRDDEYVGRGKSISSTLLKFQSNQRIKVCYHNSRNYAFSTWCLDELVKIVGCMKEMKMTILPIFYDIDPSDVRNQARTFAQAFAKHKECFKENIEKVQM